jgi:YggT family protein
MDVVVYLIQTLFGLYSLCLVARTFLGMMLGQYHGVVVFLRQITEPVLAPIRRVIPPVQTGGAYWDLSPMVALVLLWIVERIVFLILGSVF